MRLAAMAMERSMEVPDTSLSSRIFTIRALQWPWPYKAQTQACSPAPIHMPMRRVSLINPRATAAEAATVGPTYPDSTTRGDMAVHAFLRKSWAQSALSSTSHDTSLSSDQAIGGDAPHAPQTDLSLAAASEAGNAAGREAGNAAGREAGNAAAGSSTHCTDLIRNVCDVEAPGVQAAEADGLQCPVSADTGIKPRGSVILPKSDE